jgi:hypothetical protein
VEQHAQQSGDLLVLALGDEHVGAGAQIGVERHVVDGLDWFLLFGLKTEVALRQRAIKDGPTC